MKRKFLIYGAVAVATVVVALLLINGQTQQENAARVQGGGKPEASVGKNFERTFGR